MRVCVRAEWKLLTDVGSEVTLSLVHIIGDRRGAAAIAKRRLLTTVHTGGIPTARRWHHGSVSDELKRCGVTLVQGAHQTMRRRFRARAEAQRCTRTCRARWHLASETAAALTPRIEGAPPFDHRLATPSGCH
jgi:hypothetical protein